MVATLFAAINVHAYFNPQIGTWASRDPIEEAGGENVYVFCGNDSINNRDSLGEKWKVDRTGSSKAAAKPEIGDTVADLAQIIGLSAADYRKWLSPVGPTHIPASATAPITDCSEFRVPNTVHAYWAGDMWGLGKWWVHWPDSTWYLRYIGFKVVETDKSADSKPLELQSLLTETASRKELHGLYFWGHGLYPYPSTGLAARNGPTLLRYAQIDLAYKMALGLVFACDSNSGKNALLSNTPGSIWHGYTGDLYPQFGFFWVIQWIHEGDQGTGSHYRE
jgi:hypothetical protein